MKIETGVHFESQYKPMKSSVEGVKKVGKTEVDGEMDQQIKNNFPKEQELIKAIEESNKDLKLDNSRLQFSIHDKTKQIVVKVIDEATDEVMREFPSEKILDMVASMMERTGVFLDKKA